MDSFVESSEIILCGNKTYGFIARYNEEEPFTPAPLFELKSPKIAMGTKAPLRIASAVFPLPQVSLQQGFEPTLEFTTQYINHLIMKKISNVDDATANSGIVLIPSEIGTTSTPTPPTKPSYTLVKGAPVGFCLELRLFDNPAKLLKKVAAGSEVAGESYSITGAVLTFADDDHTKKLLCRYGIAVTDRGYKRGLKVTLELQYCSVYFMVRAMDVNTAKYGWFTAHFPKIFAKSIPDIEAPFEGTMTPPKWVFDLMNDLTKAENYDDLYYEYFTPDD